MLKHHFLEVGKLHYSGLIVLAKVCQVGIATDYVVGPDGVGQCEKVEVFRVADGCGDDLGLNGGELAEGIDNGQQVVNVLLTDVLSDFVAAGHVADFLYETATDIHVEA